MTQPESVAVSQTPSAPVYTLYDPGAVIFATLLGSPLAGCAIIALNYKRLGLKSKAVASIVAGVLVVALLLVLGIFLDNTNWPTGAGIASIIGTIRMANKVQSEELYQHRKAGGKIGSRWFGVLVGIAGLVLVLGISFACVLAASQLDGTRLTVGQKDEIYYSGSAAEEDARTLGEGLTRDGFFKDLGTTVLLRRDSNGSTLSFIVLDGAWNNPNTIDQFSEVARDVAGPLGGLPIRMRLLNQAGDVKKEVTVQSE